MNKEDPDSLSDQNSVLKQIRAWTRSSHVWPVIVQKGATVFIRGAAMQMKVGPHGGTSGNSGGSSAAVCKARIHIGLVFFGHLCQVRDSVFLLHEALTQLFSSSARALNTVCKTLIPCQLLCLCCKSNSIMSVSFARGAAKCPLRSRLPSRSSF